MPNGERPQEQVTDVDILDLFSEIVLGTGTAEEKLERLREGIRLREDVTRRTEARREAGGLAVKRGEVYAGERVAGVRQRMEEMNLPPDIASKMDTAQRILQMTESVMGQIPGFAPSGAIGPRIQGFPFPEAALPATGKLSFRGKVGADIEKMRGEERQRREATETKAGEDARALETEQRQIEEKRSFAEFQKDLAAKQDALKQIAEDEDMVAYALSLGAMAENQYMGLGATPSFAQAVGQKAIMDFAAMLAAKGKRVPKGMLPDAGLMGQRLARVQKMQGMGLIDANGLPTGEFAQRSGAEMDAAADAGLFGSMLGPLQPPQVAPEMPPGLGMEEPIGVAPGGAGEVGGYPAAAAAFQQAQGEMIPGSYPPAERAPSQQEVLTAGVMPGMSESEMIGRLLGRV